MVFDDDMPSPDAKKVTEPAPTAQTSPPVQRPIRRPEEHAAFAGLYRDQASAIVAFLLISGAGTEEAWDATQIAFEKAWENWHKLRTPRAWLRTTAWRAYLRTSPNTDDRRTDEPVPDRPDTDMLPEDVVLLAESTAHARALLARLPLLQRLHLAWHMDGFSYTEIAQQTGKKEPAVRQNVSRALRTLREGDK